MFRNRGNLPHIEFNQGRNENHNDNKGTQEKFHVPHYSDYMIYRDYIIYYDKNFFIIQMIISVLLLLLVVMVYLYGYKVSIFDPIKDVKNAVLTMQLIQAIAVIGITAIMMYFSKNKQSLIKNLIVISILSIIMSFTTTGIKMYMDKKYTEEVFEQFYEEYAEDKENYTDIAKVTIGITGNINIMDSKEAYIQNCKTAYTQFSIKTMIYSILNLLISVATFYIVYRLNNIEKKKEMLAKDDIILNDEEENVKY